MHPTPREEDLSGSSSSSSTVVSGQHQVMDLPGGFLKPADAPRDVSAPHAEGRGPQQQQQQQQQQNSSSSNSSSKNFVNDQRQAMDLQGSLKNQQVLQ
jgi:hypothetical protein